MFRSLVALSPKQKWNTHPRNTVRWNPKIAKGKGFYKLPWGATYMKWQFSLPYVREVDSLYHYPAVSKVTKKPINWYADDPQDGYEGLRIYGENTLELQGMPLGKTPEYVQERLRRFFAKFGPVQHCRADPHPLDPYQCEGTAYVSFRDRAAALKALKAPLKFPASLHDKVISMRHLDTDKTNDPNYLEKAKFWNSQLISIARQLHVQLMSDPDLRGAGKLLSVVGTGMWEREMVELPEPEVADPASAEAMAKKAPWGRGGVPFPKKLHGSPTRVVAAQEAVDKRFGNWAEFLSFAPLDELFSLERESGEGEAERAVIVVRPRLVSSTQRARILTRARMGLADKLHEEFSVWWREGKVPLPEYTQRRITWWDHKPHLPEELQLQSRSKDRHRIFDERWLYLRRLVKAKKERRRVRATEWGEERKKQLAEKAQKKQERRERALKAVTTAHCSGLLGNLGHLVPTAEKRRALP